MEWTESPQTPKHIVCKEKDGMFQIILNHPPINAFNLEMVEEMNAAVSNLMYRTDVKVITFLASGKNFCGGFSPEDFTDGRSYQLIEAFGRLFEQLQATGIPIFSVVQGMALGAGFELVMFSDLAMATESSRFGFPEVRIGLIPAIACNMLQKVVPYKCAAELIFSGDVITAKEAESYGLINKAVPDDKLQEQAGLMAGKLLQFSAPVLQSAKKAMTASQGKNLAESLDAVEEIYLQQLLTLDDSKEGMRAFIEKRKPVWKNR
ncbi:enoyl-CoA hydratase/isomerase family protein [bacterium]|nr:enoyl-CoA hydratase/isomerase family protein [bacterium]